MGKSGEKNKFVIDKNQPYEYNIAIVVLDELYNEGIIDIFDRAEALIDLKMLYNQKESIPPLPKSVLPGAKSRNNCGY